MAQFIGELRSAENRDKAHLIAAGDEYPVDAIEKLVRIRLNNILPRCRAKHPRICYTEVSKRLGVDIRRELREIRRHGNDQNLALVAAGKLEKLLQDTA